MSTYVDTETGRVISPEEVTERGIKIVEFSPGRHKLPSRKDVADSRRGIYRKGGEPADTGLGAGVPWSVGGGLTGFLLANSFLDDDEESLRKMPGWRRFVRKWLIPSAAAAAGAYGGYLLGGGGEKSAQDNGNGQHGPRAVYEVESAVQGGKPFPAMPMLYAGTPALATYAFEKRIRDGLKALKETPSHVPYPIDVEADMVAQRKQLVSDNRAIARNRVLSSDEKNRRLFNNNTAMASLDARLRRGTENPAIRGIQKGIKRNWWGRLISGALTAAGTAYAASELNDYGKSREPLSYLREIQKGLE